MKPLFSIIAAFMLSGAFAQKGNFILGLQGDVSSAYFFKDRVISHNSLKNKGFAGAILMQYNLDNNFSIIASPGYEQWHPDFSELSQNFIFILPGAYYDLSMNYFSLPVSIRISYGNTLKLTSDVGLYGAYLGNATFTGQAENSYYTEDFTASFNRVNYGGLFGVGAQYQCGKLILNAGLQGILGLNNVLVKSFGFFPTGNAVRVLNMKAAIGVGYRFGTK